MTQHPLYQLIRGRIKQFFREPEAIFWTYGFPLLMVIGLGIAFRNKPEQPIIIDVLEPGGEAVTSALAGNRRFEVAAHSQDESMQRLRQGRTLVVVTVNQDGTYEYAFDPSNPESRLARSAVDDALQRAAGRHDPIVVHDREIVEAGSRYIDFLVPGLIGMNLMGGGLWGIGFVLVDMRVRNLLKRLVATPMKRRDFLLSMVGVRSLFFLPEMAVLLLFAYWIFGVPVRGHPLSIVLVSFVGAMAFAGLGLLVSCRAQRIETVSGLMNLVMLPMWLMSGVFFSSDRFPDALQPFIQALPLTQLNHALRAVILEDASLYSQTIPLLILAVWAGVSFALALKWFRWQ